LAFVEPVTNVSDVDLRLEAIRREHRAATHLCYAYRCRGETTVLERAEDAGEPSGTAGAPILRQLAGAELVDVFGAVVRYFGGVKLGVGGLVRAYGAAIAAALAEAVIVERNVEITLRILFPAESNATVMRAIHHHGARVMEIRYDGRGETRVAVPPSHAAALAKAVQEATGARGCVEEVR
jgi:putative IMPACT (imprinted ancient) family translation regulator